MVELREFVQAIYQTSHPKDLLKAIQQYFEAEHGTIAWVNPTHHQLELLCRSGEGRLLAHPLTLDELFGEKHPLGAIIKSKHVFSADLAACAWWRADQFCGVLILEDLKKQLDPAESLALMEFVGDQLYLRAVQQQNHTLMEYLQHLTTFFDEVNHSISDLNALFSQTLQTLVNLFHAEVGYFMTAKQIGDQFSIQSIQAEPSRAIPSDEDQLVDWDLFIQRSLQKNRVVDPRIGDSTFAEEEILLPSLGLKSALILPLRNERQVWGVFVLGEGTHLRRFTEDEKIMAQNVARQALALVQRTQLIQDLRGLEEIKSNVIRMASHDLRNPLSQIHSYVEQLRETLSEPSARQNDYLGRISAGIERLSTQLNDLLNTEQFEVPSEHKWELVKLYPIFEQAYMSLYDQAKRKKLVYVIQVSPKLPMVYGDAIQLEHACWNLIHNAIKYTPEGGKVEIVVEVEAKRIIFRVQDTGYGIPMEKQAQLFKRFYRAKAPGTEHISGTGLGLNLVKTIIEHHHGEISFASEFGTGSRFEFWLPLSGGE